MADSILNLSNRPSDPVEAVVWLDGVLEAVQRDLDAAYEEAYFQARLQGRFEAAVEVGRTSRKRALAFTRRRNEATGRQIRWGDGADPASSAYAGS